MITRSNSLLRGSGMPIQVDGVPHLHQPMPVPQQLSQVTILRTRYPDPRKIIFPQQSQQQSGVLPVGLLFAHAIK
jgi:hypothetical protein